MDAIYSSINRVVNTPVHSPLGKPHGLTLPATGRLLYLKEPNGVGADAGKYVATAGDAAMFAALGSWWYTDVNTPIARSADELMLMVGPRFFYSHSKGLAIYDTDLVGQNLTRVKSYLGIGLSQFYGAFVSQYIGNNIDSYFPSYSRLPDSTGYLWSSSALTTTPKLPSGVWVGKAYKNELSLGSENFSTGWSNGRLLVGAEEADKSHKISINNTSGAQYLVVSRSNVQGTARCFSVDFKPGTVDKAVLRVCYDVPSTVSDRFVLFNLTNKTVGTINYSNYNARIETLPDGFVRCSLVNLNIGTTTAILGFSLGVAENIATCGYASGDYLYARWACEVISNNHYPYLQASYTSVPGAATTTGNGSAFPLTVESGKSVGYGYSPGDIVLGLFADPHYAADKANASTILSNVSTLISAFNSAKVDAIVSPGDCYSDFNWHSQSEADADISTFEGLFSAADTENILFATGNHDAEYYNPWRSQYTKKNDIMDVGSNWRIITFFNAEKSGGTPWTATTETLAWLESALESAHFANKKIIVITHARIDQNYPGTGPLNMSGTPAQSGTIIPAATTGNGVSVSLSEATFAANIVGKWVFLKHGTTWGGGIVVSRVSDTQITVDISYAFSNTTAAEAWCIDGLTDFSYNSADIRKKLADAKTAGADIVCCLTGHIHVNYEATIAGINYRTFKYTEFSPVGFLIRITQAGAISYFSHTATASAYRAYSPGVGVVAAVIAGSASTDITEDTNVLSLNNTAANVLFIAAGGTVKATDSVGNTATVTISSGWARTDKLAVMLKTNGATFQVGYSKSPYSAVTWGAPHAFSGSFGAGVELKAALNCGVLMHLERMATWNRIVSDAEIKSLLGVG